MNTHFDITNNPGRARLEALKSLSIHPLPEAPQATRRLTRRLFLLLGLAALAAGSAASLAIDWQTVITLWSTGFAAHPTSEAPAEQTVAGVQARVGTASPLEPIAAASPAREVTGSGFVVAPRTTAIYAKYEGKVTAIAVRPGDRVAAGAVLVTLEDTGARFALETAEVARRQAELVVAARGIDLAQAQGLQTRTEVLGLRGAVSRQAMDDARTATAKAANAQEQAEQALASADLALHVAEERVAALTIRAPFAGTVTHLEAHLDDMVLARADTVRESQSLLALTDTANLFIDADVAETAIAALRPGLNGQAVLDGFPDQPFAVSIASLAPVVSAEKGTITLRLSLSHPPAGIRPNMAARIRLTLDPTGEATR
ncbi:efflux RND transporter periplasmic adaptor subunit [Oryzibacter oryziterrae]|uniref:efflux RND transporter periplasmic adaptor subunit n=1 Tax=Oryzibacter oryziterrae TaxID=2766474 RepID=UPI001F0077A0|nr:efflux RND transporter periplasmic adaptor subunit [Oryzibacter oryziterrae]